MRRAAMVTFAIGEKYRALGGITHKAFKRYADRCGLDLIIVTEHSTGCLPVFEKMIAASLMERYDRVLIVDTDIVIAPDCPDLLQIVPDDKFGAYLVSAHTDYHDSAITLIQEHLKPLGWERDYFNAGLMVASKMHRPLFDQNVPDFATWTKVCKERPPRQTFSEQTYLNYKWQELGFALFDIGYAYNHTLAVRNSAARFSSPIVHCKGHVRGTRLKEVKRTAFVMERPRLRRLFVWMPGLTRAFDALP